ncbi:hypothetical protein [Nonomuraea sp. NPDC049784]|uniref:hypothetical protein n=1 Tax=Nonomuraea sp. NPDC049784 TaxID=3154361 RepID=UPI0033E27FBB
MPNLKSVMAGLAVSTVLTGGVVGLGATYADATTQFTGGNFLTGDDDDDDDAIFFTNDDDDDDNDDRGFEELFPLLFANGGFNNGNNGNVGNRGCRRGGGGWRSNRRHVCVTVSNDNINFNTNRRRDRRDEREKDHREFKKKNHHENNDE